MKASEAPEKLYIFNPEKREVWFSKTSDKQVEYTRTDALIEKAEEFVYSVLNEGIMSTANIEDFMRLFKKYMEE